MLAAAAIMGYKSLLHKDAAKHERIWLRIDHAHELFVQNSGDASYIDVSHLSRTFAQPLIVLFAGHGRWFAGGQMTRQTQTGVVGIEYLCSGDLMLMKSGAELPVQAGSVYFIRRDFPDADHVGAAGGLTKRYVWLTGVILENLLRSLHLWHLHVLPLPRPREFEALLRRMTALLDANLPDVDLQASVLAYQMLLLLGQSLKPSLPPLIEEALAFMQKNLHRPLRIEEICDQLGVNETHLRRLFSRHMDISPMAYFSQQKFNWSANLLSTSSFSIKQIAYEIGYDDPFYFSNQFKKYFGVSPKQYRETNPFS